MCDARAYFTGAGGVETLFRARIMLDTPEGSGTMALG